MRRVLALLLVAATLSVGAPASADHLEPDATLSGRVTDASGAPVGDICVVARHDWGFLFETSSGADGTWSMSVPAGNLTLRFISCADPDLYIDQWYDHADSESDATTLSIDPGQTAEGLDATLRLGGAIEGTVTDESGRPVPGACVQASPLDGFPQVTRYTSSDGSYRIGGLLGGSYLVRFRCVYQPPPMFVPRQSPWGSPVAEPSSEAAEDYAPEWFDDAVDRIDASPVVVTEGAVTGGIDAALVRGGVVRGTARDENGRPVEDQCVGAYDDTRGLVATTDTDSHGLYVLTGLPLNRPLRIAFGCWGGAFESEWYHEAGSFRTATPVSVTADVVLSGIDATLAARRFSDVAVADVRVKPVPLQTDVADVPAGWVRDIEVTLENRGTAPSYFSLLTVSLRTEDSEDQLAWEGLDVVQPGQRVTRTYRWNGAGSFGDIEVVAALCTGWEEWGSDNDRMSTYTYVGVGGTGFGVLRRQSSAWVSCG